MRHILVHIKHLRDKNQQKYQLPEITSRVPEFLCHRFSSLFHHIRTVEDILKEVDRMNYFLLYRRTKNIQYIYGQVSVFQEGCLFIFKNCYFSLM